MSRQKQGYVAYYQVLGFNTHQKQKAISKVLKYISVQCRVQTSAWILTFWSKRPKNKTPKCNHQRHTQKESRNSAKLLYCQRAFGVFCTLNFMLMLTGYKRRHFRWDIRITADTGSWEKRNTAFLITTVFITCRVYIYHNRSTLNLTTLISHLKATFYNKSCNKDFSNESRTSLTWIFMMNVNIFTSNPYCFRPVWGSEGKIWLHDEAGKAHD